MQPLKSCRNCKYWLSALVSLRSPCRLYYGEEYQVERERCIMSGYSEWQPWGGPSQDELKGARK